MNILYAAAMGAAIPFVPMFIVAFVQWDSRNITREIGWWSRLSLLFAAFFAVIAAYEQIATGGVQ